MSRNRTLELEYQIRATQSQPRCQIEDPVYEAFCLDVRDSGESLPVISQTSIASQRHLTNVTHAQDLLEVIDFQLKS